MLGLDSLPPYVLYEGNDGGGLKFIRGQLLDDSARYLMRTCHPPITVPAWMVMFTGRSPGELGLYGFRHRRPGSFESYVVTSQDVKESAIWDDLGRKGVRFGLFGVPPTYPPKPVNGFMVTDFNTPGPHRPYTFPPWLKNELESSVGAPVFDVVYRTEDRDAAMKDVLEMVRNHLRTVDYLARSKAWDAFIYVEIGVDRAHHAFWKYFDRRHPRYTYHERWSAAIPMVYSEIDSWLERAMKGYLKDSIVVIVSDHGTKPMVGAFAINQWLEEQGYLRLRERPRTPGQDLTADMIDWGHTLVWAWGGYYSRFFFNIKGREPHGIIGREELESLVKQVKQDVARIRGPGGEPWRNEAYEPLEIYPVARGDAPDLTVYLDDLNWRPIGTVGWPSNYMDRNDKGPDDSMHDWLGVLTVYDPEGTVSRGDMGVIDITKVRGLLEELIMQRR